MGIELILAFVFGVFFVGTILIVAIFVKNPTDLLITIIRIIIALAGAGVAAVIPGMLKIDASIMTKATISASGAIAVFVVIYFFTPSGLIRRTSTENYEEEILEADPKEVIDLWFRFMDSEQYETAYDMLSKLSKDRHKKESIIELFAEQRSPLGRVKHRKIYGIHRATSLPNGDVGTFRIFIYDTDFQSGENRKEYITLRAEDHNWKIHSHNISASNEFHQSN